MIIPLYAGGMTIGDIEYHLAATVGTELSREMIWKIADEVLPWQLRPLNPWYSVIYLDALVVKVHDGAHVRNKAAHIAVGVDMEDNKDVLGIWVQAVEGAKFWAVVCAAGQPRDRRRPLRPLPRTNWVPQSDRGDLAAPTPQASAQAASPPALAAPPTTSPPSASTRRATLPERSRDATPSARPARQGSGNLPARSALRYGALSS